MRLIGSGWRSPRGRDQSSVEGRGGVMEAACKGCPRRWRGRPGVSSPRPTSGEANAYCDFVVATGMGQSRNFIVAYSGDAMVVVGGGAGTLTEAAVSL